MGNSISFQVYKASAGSGKTYSLVREYLLLLFENRYDNQAFRKVLAVTFTNKATGEMKARIVKSLYEISQGGGGGYVDDIRRKYGSVYGSDEAVRGRALEVLKTILDGYSNFNIKTIDSFFQQILRGFARELNYYSAFRVELDRNVLIEMVFDDMVNGLNSEDNVYEYMRQFALMNVADEKSLNVKKSILDVVKKLFDDDFVKKTSGVMGDMKGVIGGVNDEYDRCLKEVKGVCGRVMGALGENELSIDELKGKSKTPLTYFDFDKLKGKGFCPDTKGFDGLLSGDEDERVALLAGKKNEVDIRAFVRVIAGDLDGFSELLMKFRTVTMIRKNVCVYAIMNEVKCRLEEKAQKENLLLISSTGEFISKIIEGSTTPFIYEKTGVNIDDYMIDEFQDTSRIQWENFMPLLEESVAKGGRNLIVGDVKQSIYRWRGGDWSLLNKEVEDVFDGVDVMRLDSNYRSWRNVVENNNKYLKAVVEKVGELLQEECYGILEKGIPSVMKTEFLKMYDDVEQKVVKDKDGGYHLRWVGKEGNSNEWKKDVMGRMLGDICELREMGYAYSDITILVRKNGEAEMLAAYLMGEGLPVVSSDALALKSSSVVM